MKKVIFNLKWLFDLWIKEYTFEPNDSFKYQNYMFEKWGERYTEAYIKNITKAHNK